MATKKIYEINLRCGNCGMKQKEQIPYGKKWVDYIYVKGKVIPCKNCGCEKLRG